MSNTAVGTLYKRIIDQVVESSRADFEENGVNNRMVQTFQETWQDHLSKRRTAHFPWEPAPASEAAETAPVSGRGVPPTARSGHATSPPVQNNGVGNGVHIKQEPGQGNDTPAMSMAPATGFASAEDRAAHLSQQYQMNRQGSYNPISLPQQQNQPGYGNAQYSNQQVYAQQRVPQQQWNGASQQRDVKPHLQAQQSPDIKQSPPQIKQEQRSEGLGLSQTDGTGDKPDARAQWTAIVAHNREVKADPETMRKSDGLLKRQLAEQMRTLEGGGLLVPLEERYSAEQRQTGTRRSRPSSSARGNGSQAKPNQDAPRTAQAQLDGGEDDEDDDKDAINSDLDDPEDELDDDNVGDEYEGDTIICLYDKVQRVKNKWKCTLKDGVVNADGKDYVFHKANGEFEW